MGALFHLVDALTAATLRSRDQEVRVRVTESVARSEEAKAASRRSGKRTELMPRRRWRRNDVKGDGGRRIIVVATGMRLGPRLGPLAALSPPQGWKYELLGRTLRSRQKKHSLSE